MNSQLLILTGRHRINTHKKSNWSKSAHSDYAFTRLCTKIANFSYRWWTWYARQRIPLLILVYGFGWFTLFISVNICFLFSSKQKKKPSESRPYQSRCGISHHLPAPGPVVCTCKACCRLAIYHLHNVNGQYVSFSLASFPSLSNSLITENERNQKIIIIISKPSAKDNNAVNVWWQCEGVHK